jgi:hypothetical protein
MDSDRNKPACSSCGKPMHLVRTVPGVGGLPELRVYSCKTCGVSFTKAAEPAEQAARHQIAMA